jgi:hypothetical protein
VVFHLSSSCPLSIAVPLRRAFAAARHQLTHPRPVHSEPRPPLIAQARSGERGPSAIPHPRLHNHRPK